MMNYQWRLNVRNLTHCCVLVLYCLLTRVVHWMNILWFYFTRYIFLCVLYNTFLFSLTNCYNTFSNCIEAISLCLCHIINEKSNSWVIPFWTLCDTRILQNWWASYFVIARNTYHYYYIMARNRPQSKN